MVHISRPNLGLPTIAWQPEFLWSDPGKIVVLHQCRFPESYDISRINVIGGPARLLFQKPGGAKQDDEDRRVRECFERHLSRGPQCFERGPLADVSNRQLLVFMKDLLEVDRVCPVVKWFGFQITLTHDLFRTSQSGLLIHYFIAGDRRGRSIPIHPDSDELVAMSGMDCD